MANTTNFNWETPDDTDLVKDGAAAIRTLGSAIDTSLVDLKGGTTGQILSKATGTDMDFTWITNDVGDITAVSAGTGISGGGTSGAITITNDMATTITAAGDIVVGTGSGTYDNLPIGTTGQVLTADTTVSPYKVKWAAAGGGGSSTFVGCRLYKTSNQTMSTGTWTTITYDAESFDTDGFHSTSSNTSRITIPSGKGGYYLINVRVNIDANATGARLARLTVNTNELFAGTEFAGSSAASSKYTFSTIQNLSVGDYVEVLCLQNSGGNLDFVGNSTAPHNEFSVQYLGA